MLDRSEPSPQSLPPPPSFAGKWRLALDLTRATYSAEKRTMPLDRLYLIPNGLTISRTSAGSAAAADSASGHRSRKSWSVRSTCLLVVRLRKMVESSSLHGSSANSSSSRPKGDATDAPPHAATSVRSAGVTSLAPVMASVGRFHDIADLLLVPDTRLFLTLNLPSPTRPFSPSCRRTSAAFLQRVAPSGDGNLTDVRCGLACPPSPPSSAIRRQDHPLRIRSGGQPVAARTASLRPCHSLAGANAQR